MKSAFDPGETYVLLSGDGSASHLSGGEAFWSQSQEQRGRFGRDWLVSEFECSADWESWEMHPNADEFVYLLSGDAVMQLEDEAGVTEVALEGRRAVVIPRGVWHTAKVSAPSRMLFVTLGAGTQHRPVSVPSS